ncbi:toll/interleukin-1 receptor domain-containing protein [Bacillus paramycoides]|uniref:toll/interleukin-1 receptor domain-containing protein n=1 Tax=Bacillus paramycoides TaxID=2026194 RepID=UPI00382012EE
MHKKQLLLIIQIVFLLLIIFYLLHSNFIIISFSWERVFSTVGGIVGGLVAGIVSSKLFEKLTKKKPNVYISYSHADKEFVNKLKQDLSSLNVTLFNDIVSIGENFSEAIEVGIKEVDYVIIVISEEYIRSKFLHAELKEIIRQKKKIFPVVIDGTDLPNQLDEVYFLRFTEPNYKESLQELISSLNKFHKKVT